MTSMRNAGSEVVATPSDTRMTMFAYRPMLLFDGVPLSLPLVVLNAVQVGLFWIEYVSFWPSGSLPLGWNA